MSVLTEDERELIRRDVTELAMKVEDQLWLVEYMEDYIQQSRVRGSVDASV